MKPSVVLGTKTEIPTLRLARRRLDAVLARINAADYRPGRVATVAEFAERWKEEVLVHHKPSTVKAAESHLRCHILPQLGTLKLNEVNREVQQLFVTRMCRKVSRKMILNVIGTLSVMLNKSKEWGYICEGVRFGSLTLPVRGVEKPVRFFSADEGRSIIETAPQPYRTMFAIAATTGMRAGEVLGLQIEDLDFGRGLIFVRRSVWRGRIQTTKSRASTKPLPMPGLLVPFLKSYLATWRPNAVRLLFLNRRGRPFNATKVVQKGLWPILEKLEIQHCGLHAFRHTHSSLLLEVGAPPSVAQEQLRHSDPRITLGIYSHVIGDSQRNAVDKVAGLLLPDAPKSDSDGQWIQ